LTDLLGTDPSLQAVTKLIRERTGGNPFFTEEVVQSLIESGSLQGTKGAHRLVTPLEQIVVPATVQAVLAARIDRLLEREKRALQAAAVIGKTFPESILKAVAELPEPVGGTRQQSKVGGGVGRLKEADMPVPEKNHASLLSDPGQRQSSCSGPFSFDSEAGWTA